MFKSMLVVVMILVGMASNAFAHAVSGKDVSAAETRVVEFAYSTGDLAAYVTVNVFSPADPNVEFQNGRTDAQGRFAFTPDRPGTWTIVLADGMGHKISYPVEVAFVASPAASLPKAESGIASQSMLFRGILGVSILLNLFFGVALFRRRF